VTHNPSMADRSAEIARLEAILNAGARSVTTDGQKVDYDLDAIRRRLAELRAEDDNTLPKRPRAASIRLTGF